MRAADRAFVADHHDIAGYDIAAEDADQCGFFAFIDLGRALEIDAFLAGVLPTAPPGRVAAQDAQVRLSLIGLSQGRMMSCSSG